MFLNLQSHLYMTLPNYQITNWKPCLALGMPFFTWVSRFGSLTAFWEQVSLDLVPDPVCQTACLSKRKHRSRLFFKWPIWVRKTKPYFHLIILSLHGGTRKWNADKQRPILLLSIGGSMYFQKCRELSLSFLPPVFPLNPELLYTWLKSNLFNAIEFLTLQSFYIFNLISSLKCPCEVGRAGIIKPIWIMSKKSPRRWSVLLHIPREEILASWLLSQWLSFLFFFIIPGILSDLDILFSNSLVSWLRLEGRVWEIDCGGRKKVQKGKMLTWLAYQ